MRSEVGLVGSGSERPDGHVLCLWVVAASAELRVTTAHLGIAATHLGIAATAELRILSSGLWVVAVAGLWNATTIGTQLAAYRIQDLPFVGLVVGFDGTRDGTASTKICIASHAELGDGVAPWQAKDVIAAGANTSVYLAVGFPGVAPQVSFSRSSSERKDGGGANESESSESSEGVFGHGCVESERRTRRRPR